MYLFPNLNKSALITKFEANIFFKKIHWLMILSQCGSLLYFFIYKCQETLEEWHEFKESGWVFTAVLLYVHFFLANS